MAWDGRSPGILFGFSEARATNGIKPRPAPRASLRSYSGGEGYGDMPRRVDFPPGPRGLFVQRLRQPGFASDWRSSEANSIANIGGPPERANRNFPVEITKILTRVRPGIAVRR